MRRVHTAIRASPNTRAIRHTSPLFVVIAGVTVSITGAPPRIRADLAALLRSFVVRDSNLLPLAPTVNVAITTVSDETAHDDWLAFVDGEQALRTGSAERFTRDLEWLIVSQAMARSSNRLIWHAASLTWRGQAVTLVAESGSGKSTLTVGLAMRGWRPLADDLTLYDPSRHALEPFRRCFHVSPAVAERAAPAQLLTWPAPALTDYARPRRWGAAGARPAWVVIVRRDTSQPSSLAPISRAEAAGALFSATVRNRVELSASLAAHVAGSVVSCWNLNNNDLTTALDLLESTLLGATHASAPDSADGARSVASIEAIDRAF